MVGLGGKVMQYFWIPIPKRTNFPSHYFFWKREMGEYPSIQPKGPKKQSSVSAYQHGRVVPVKRNLVTSGRHSPVSEIQEVCQSLVENTFIRILLPLLLVFFSFFDLYKVIKSLYLSLEKAQSKNNVYVENMPWPHLH